MAFSVVMARIERRSEAIGLLIGGGGGEGRGGSGGIKGRGGVAPARDVSDIISRPPGPVSKAARSSSQKGAPTTQAASQVSPTGPAVLSPSKNTTRTKESQEERIERIRRGLRTVPAAKPTTAKTSKTAAKSFRADSIADRLRSGISSGASGDGDGGTPNGTGNGKGSGSGGGRGSGNRGDGLGSGGTGNGRGSGNGDGLGNGSGPGDPFFTAIGTALYDAWTPPLRADVGRGNPTVGVRITLRSDGTLTAYQLTRPSGNSAMDGSVEALMRSLKRLPAPSSFGFKEAVKTFEVRFALDAVDSG
jgi:TonB family protein